MSIIIISSGSPNLGYGHIRRSSVLHDFLKAKGFDSRHLILNDIDRMISHLKGESKFSLNLIVIDSPLDCSSLILAARNLEIKTLTLDGNSKIEADYDISLDARNKFSDSVTRFAGFKYTIISNQILKYRSNFKFKEVLNKKVTVAIGGGDVLNKGVETAEFLALNGFDVSLIAGPYANYKIDKNWNFNIFINPNNIGEIFANSGWMVTNCGHTLLEAMCLGKACFVLPQTEAERELAKYFFENKLIIGYANSMPEGIPELPNAICGRNAFTFVDGGGAERISRILEDIFETNKR